MNEAVSTLFIMIFTIIFVKNIGRVDNWRGEQLSTRPIESNTKFTSLDSISSSRNLSVTPMTQSTCSHIVTPIPPLAVIMDDIEMRSFSINQFMIDEKKQRD